MSLWKIGGSDSTEGMMGVSDKEARYLVTTISGHLGVFPDTLSQPQRLPDCPKISIYGVRYVRTVFGNVGMFLCCDIISQLFPGI